MRKKRLIIILSSIIFPILLFFLYCFLVLKGYIPFKSYAHYEFFYENIYSPLKLDRWDKNILPQMRIVMNYPCVYYFINRTDKIKSDIRLNANTGPLLFHVDYNYNLLFAAAKPNILIDFEQRNKPNIIDEKSYLKQIQKNDIRSITDRMVLLKLGDLWQRPFYANIYIKLYNNGDAIFNYIWYDRKKISDHHEWKLNEISIRIPVEKEFILKKIDSNQLSFIYKMATFETKLFGSPQSADAMIIKNSDEVRIVCRDQGSFKMNRKIRNYWGEVIIKSGLAENLKDIINRQETIPLEEWELKYIIDRLNYFIK